jgi:hypothetical protein
MVEQDACRDGHSLDAVAVKVEGQRVAAWGRRPALGGFEEVVEIKRDALATVVEIATVEVVKAIERRE